MKTYKKKLYEEELKEEMRTRGLHYFTLELEKLGIKLKQLVDIAEHIRYFTLEHRLYKTSTQADLEELEGYKEAFNEEWLRLAAKKKLFKNNSTAQYILGRMYDNGQGVPESYKEALKCYQLAAKHGNAEARFLSSARNGQRIILT